MRRPASTLSAYAECAHLAWLDRRVALGVEPAPASPDEAARLLFRHGQEHERRYLERLRARGIEIVEIVDPYTRAAAAEAETRSAMAAGAPLIYQGVLGDATWWGIPDFLRRVERPSDLGEWSYEVVDAKLAKRPKPAFLLQLGLYSELLGEAQGAVPEWLHLVLGSTGEDEEPVPFRVDDFAAYVRRLRARAVAATDTADEPAYPDPVEHCGVCSFDARCAARREADDHLSRVANIRASQVERLVAGGVPTLRALAALPETAKVKRIAPATLATLRRQARLQQAQIDSGAPSFEFLPAATGRGFALLPPPSPGDVFFDMEGDPYADPRLEYLFGATWIENGEPTYRAWWAHTRDEEKAAFEDFVDWVLARRAADPEMHVHHYAAYEPTALKRLAGAHATREDAIDDLLRGRVFVDLYTVVRQGLVVSQPSYSIKKIEKFYAGRKREGEVQDAGQSIIAYEKWLDTRDETILRDLELYNRADCDSTLELRDWLLARKLEAPTPDPAAAPPPRTKPEREETDAARAKREKRERDEKETADLVALLGERAARAQAPKDAADLRLLAGLLEYHARERRPIWWGHFARLAMTEDELVDDVESIAGLAPDPAHPPVPEKKSMAHAFTYPVQETKLGEGSTVVDLVDGGDAGEILAIDRERGTLVLKRGPSLAEKPLPRAIAVKPVDIADADKRDAVRRLARAVVEHGWDGPGPYRALRSLVRGADPRVRGHAIGTPLLAADEGTVTETAAAPVVLGLDESALFVQGPPGSGKTWLGARLILHALAQGKRVGVVAHAHRAIINLLHAVEEVAEERGVRFRGVKKSSDGNEDSVFVSKLEEPRIVDTASNDGVEGFQLVAGTAWLFARPELDSTFDLLFVDEAGQIALADAIASGVAARNVVYLGDPHQLAQVSQAVHPDGAGRSVLEHLLGESATVPPERGLFLGTSWRMHPEVCAFVSESFYDRRLHAAPGRERQRVDARGALSGAGLRFVPVEHAGNGQRAPEEAERVADLVRGLLEGGTWTDVDGARHPLGPEGIRVLTPYNAQVQELVSKLPDGVPVGTVDRFQGQEAPVVFYSMATSSGEDLPRSLEFLMSRNRLNVAVSRARALAVIVASPRLLDVACRTVEEMRLANALCRFAERAEVLPGPP